MILKLCQNYNVIINFEFIASELMLVVRCEGIATLPGKYWNTQEEIRKLEDV